MNIGIQREIRPGMVLTADYVRNVTTQLLAGIDINHVGDAKYFNLGVAQQAIADTLNACGATSIDDAISGHRCSALEGFDDQGNPNPVLMSDFANSGLTSSADFGGPAGAVRLAVVPSEASSPSTAPCPSCFQLAARSITACR